MYRPVDITLTELKKFNELYGKVLSFMIRENRELVLNHDKFKKYIVEVLGFKTSERVYNFIVFRHYFLSRKIDKLICGV
tara:strand:+ start:196 stop:432 length:237 start_codon:yes stop_codon:yes gene_type:complete